MRTILPTLTLTATVTCAATSLAQNVCGPSDPGIRSIPSNLPSPAFLAALEDDATHEFPLAAGSSTHRVVLDFTFDGLPDILTLIDNQPMLIVSPGVLQYVIPLPVPPGETVTAVSFARDAQNRLAMSGSTGSDVILWTIDSATGQISYGVGADSTGSGPCSDWANAHWLLPGDFDGDGDASDEVMGYFIHAVPQGGVLSTLRYGRWVGEHIVTEATLPLTTYAPTATVANWITSTACDELIVSMGTRFVAFDIHDNGTNDVFRIRDFRFMPLNAFHLTSISDARGMGMVFLLRDAASTEFLQVVRPSASGAQLEALVPLGMLQTNSLTSGDFLVSARGDLLLGGLTVYALPNISSLGGVTYDTEDLASFGGMQEDGNEPPRWVVTGDFDGDGDRDGASANTASLTISRGASASQATLQPLVPCNVAERFFTDVPGVAGARIMTTEFYNLALMRVLGATELDIQLYLPDVTGAAYFAATAPFPPTGSVMGVNVPYDASGLVGAVDGYLVVRGIQRDSSGNISARFPAAGYAVTLNEGGQGGDSEGNIPVRPVVIPPIIPPPAPTPPSPPPVPHPQ